MQCDLGLFKKAFKLAKLCADPKSTMPALGELVLSADNGVGTIRSTNINLAIDLTFSTTGDLEPQAVPIMNMGNLLKALKGKQEISVEKHPDLDRLVVKAGKRTFSTELGFSLKDRPKARKAFKRTKEFPHAKGSVDGEILLEALNFVSLAICKDETRFHLNQAAWIGNDLVSTDGHRLHLYPLGALGRNVENTDLRLSPKCVDATIEALKILKPGYAMIMNSSDAGHRQSVFHIEGAFMDAVITETLPRESGYPPYEQIIPNNYEFICTLGSELLDAAKTAKPMINSIETPEFKLRPKGMDLVVETNSFDETIGLQASVPEGIDGLEFGCNVNYVLDALSLVKNGEVVSLCFNEELDPLCIRYHDIIGALLGAGDLNTPLAVIMPQRLK